MEQTKHVCDCCQKEIVENGEHYYTITDHKPGEHGYSHDFFDLCDTCMNNLKFILLEYARADDDEDEETPETEAGE